MKKNFVLFWASCSAELDVAQGETCVRSVLLARRSFVRSLLFVRTDDPLVNPRINPPTHPPLCINIWVMRVQLTHLFCFCLFRRRLCLVSSFLISLHLLSGYRATCFCQQQQQQQQHQLVQQSGACVQPNLFPVPCCRGFVLRC